MNHLTHIPLDPAPLHPASLRPHAVVIGSGFGGLAAAVRLGARGYRVSVLEKLDAPGGRAYVYRQDGFTFDAGPTIITAPFLFEELWALCGKKLSDEIEIRAVDPFYTIRFDDGSTFDVSADPAAMEAQIVKFSPGDLTGFRKFMALSKRICKIGFEDLAHVPFGRFSDMLRVLPDLLRLGSYRTVFGLVSSYIKDPKLRVVFSFHSLLIGGNPLQASSILSLIPHLEKQWGVHCAMGGTGRLVQGLVGLIEGQGGSLRCNADVAEILVENNAACGVRLESGEVIAADIVVSNADSAWTYRKMLPARYRKRWTDWRLDKSAYSMSLFVWYFGTNRQYAEVPHHTIVLGPRYEGLLRDIFGKKHLSDDFSLYLHRPSATDPSLAPAGCDAFYVLSPVPHLGSGTDWREAAEPYRQAIQKRLEETMLPGLSDAIVTSEMLTPLGFQERMHAYKGAAFGLAPLLRQSAWFRPHNRSEEIDRFYLVGSGTHPGAGVPGVLSSARVLDKVVPHAAALV